MAYLLLLDVYDNDIRFSSVVVDLMECSPLNNPELPLFSSHGAFAPP